MEAKAWRLSWLVSLLCRSLASPKDYDVVVYGSSPAGIAAATAAGELGMKVALFEPLPMIGGMGAAGNLALNDGGQAAERTGLARRFTLLNGQYYGLDSEVAHPESFVSEQSFHSMLGNASVARVQLGCRLLGATTSTITTSASQNVSMVQSIRVSCQEDPVTATVFIDASYDGEIMVAAGNIEYTAGRESIATYNESLAGARVPGVNGVSGPFHVDALKPDGTTIKFVANLTDLAAPGEADDALMAFQHRMCISGDQDRVPWPKPKGYEAEDFLLIQRALHANNNNSDFFTKLPPSSLPGYPGNKKKFCLCCGITVGATDQPMLNKGWANASWERRQEIVADHTYFELGSFYFLSHDDSVPPEVREKFNQYGLCRDEFQSYNYIPPQLYVRISNRLVGDFVLTQNNIANPRNKDDSIGVGDWSFDEHMTNKFAVPVGGGKYEVQLEGNFWPPVEKNGSNWYDVPFKVMLPKRGTGSNLLVPVALSASAVAYSSARIENMFMNVGSAAGAAALQLVASGVETVQDVDVAKVQSLLKNTFRQRLHGPPGGNAPQVCDTRNSSITSIAVSGSASGTQGTYVRTSNASDGLPIFQMDDTHQLYRSGGVWRIASFGQFLYYVADGSIGIGNGPPPAEKGVWRVAGKGAAPTPISITCKVSS